MPALILVLLNLLHPLVGANDPCTCLPKDITRSDVVSTQSRRSIRGGAINVTVEQTLKQIKARCRKGKLVDPAGKEIYFFRLQGCWGNPPEDYQEVLKQQQQELERLRKRYRVIEMTCNPGGEPIP
jgi:hypothetical protein